MGWQVLLFMQLWVADFFFILFFFFLFSHLTIQNFRVVLSFTGISTMFLFFKKKFLIFIPGLFVKFQFVFNFRIESIIVIYNFFLNMVSLLWLWFLILDLFVNLVFVFNFSL
jgi:hypothetical protein